MTYTHTPPILVTCSSSSSSSVEMCGGGEPCGGLLPSKKEEENMQQQQQQGLVDNQVLQQPDAELAAERSRRTQDWVDAHPPKEYVEEEHSIFIETPRPPTLACVEEGRAYQQRHAFPPSRPSFSSRLIDPLSHMVREKKLSLFGLCLVMAVLVLVSTEFAVGSADESSSAAAAAATNATRPVTQRKEKKAPVLSTEQMASLVTSMLQQLFNRDFDAILYDFESKRVKKTRLKLVREAPLDETWGSREKTPDAVEVVKKAQTPNFDTTVKIK